MTRINVNSQLWWAVKAFRTHRGRWSGVMLEACAWPQHSPVSSCGWHLGLRRDFPGHRSGWATPFPIGCLVPGTLNSVCRKQSCWKVNIDMPQRWGIFFLKLFRDCRNPSQLPSAVFSIFRGRCFLSFSHILLLVRLRGGLDELEGECPGAAATLGLNQSRTCAARTSVFFSVDT